MARLALPLNVLANLDFGAPAAERDIGRGLEKYFIESVAYKRVRSGAKTIILGNRGSGKSAIFQILARRERSAGSHVIELSPEDYSYELLSSTMTSEKSGSWVKHGAYAAAWKYLIYILVMKEISKKGMRLKKGAATAIYRYVRDNHGADQMGRLAVLISYLRRLEAIKLGPIEAGLKARELDKLYKLEEIHHLLPALKEVLARQRVVVLVDELDRGWDSSEDAKAFVAGLFQACVSINGLHENLSVYISLRQELYDDIPALYEDAQKYRDLLEIIRWDEDSLLKLITRRIRHSAREKGYGDPDLEKSSDTAWWSAVFAAPPGHPADTCFRYMIDRTLYRPREIIQFCTEVVELARSRTSGLPLPYAAISWAERSYSEERAKDIAAEYRFQYPGLLSVFEVFRGRSPTFDRENLQLLCLELATGGLPTGDTSSWLPDRDPDDLIDILWHVGFLEGQPDGGVISGNPHRSFLGVHQVQHLNLALVQYFRVHAMFRAYLGMAEETPG